MRIDDDNKTVYISKQLFNEITKLKEGIGIVGIVSLFQILWEYQKDYPEIQKFLWSHENDIWANDEEPFPEDDKYNQVLMVKIWSDEYRLELELPQKYYWRKKKEHLASFELQERSYLNYKEADGEAVLADNYETASIKTKFTEQKASKLLKDDFDKFEKVEC